MDHRGYEIPSAAADALGVGQWVEIFEAFGGLAENTSILVKTLRIEGQTLSFDLSALPPGEHRELRPHEGEIVSLVKGAVSAIFHIRM